jgi:hypothetical protein
MFRSRSLILLGISFLAASAAWADEVGYVDCSNHSDGTQVFGKPRKSPEVVASLPCGERFTILVYGFYFSRIQTKDGQIGYIYSNLIAVDRGAAAVQQTPSMQVAAERTKIPSTRNADVKANALASGQPQSAAAQPAPVSAPALRSSPVSPSSVSSPADTSATTSASVSPAAAPTILVAPVAAAQPDAPPAVQPAPAPPQPLPTPSEAAAVQTIPAPSVEPASSAATPNPPETPAPVAQPDPTVTAAQPDLPAPAQPEPVAQPAQPEPAPAKPARANPASPAIRPADTHETWEKPLPSVRQAPLIELYGGYAFARMVSGGTSTNFNGALGSFGWNVKPWLQIVGDSSYSFVNVGGTKNLLYGNHYGARYYYHTRNRWSVMPFAEALVGGSRADTTVTGTGGYTTSQNSISFKVGGGLDLRPSRRWEIRLLDFDYYRTSFGTSVHQNNYWASTGIVLRLFGGSE